MTTNKYNNLTLKELLSEYIAWYDVNKYFEFGGNGLYSKSMQDLLYKLASEEVVTKEDKRQLDLTVKSYSLNNCEFKNKDVRSIEVRALFPNAYENKYHIVPCNKLTGAERNKVLSDIEKRGIKKRLSLLDDCSDSEQDQDDLFYMLNE